LVKRGFEQADERRARHALGEEPDAGDVRRIMRGRDAVECLHRLHSLFVESYAAIEPLGHDGFESDRSQVFLTRDGAAVFQPGKTILNRPGIIGYTLEAAFVQQALLVVGEIEQPPLERGRADVGDEDFHGLAVNKRRLRIQLRCVYWQSFADGSVIGATCQGRKDLREDVE
jgi:hypothetical protein